MRFQVALKRVETGEIRLVEGRGDWDCNAEGNWTEGNYSCDCNRGILFDRTSGEEKNWNDYICSANLYSLEYILLEDGWRLFPDEHGNFPHYLGTNS